MTDFLEMFVCCHDYVFLSQTFQEDRTYGPVHSRLLPFMGYFVSIVYLVLLYLRYYMCMSYYMSIAILVYTNCINRINATDNLLYFLCMSNLCSVCGILRRDHNSLR